MTDRDPLDLPEELREFPDDAAGPTRSLGVRLAALVVAIALLLMTVGVWMYQAGLIIPM